MGKSHRGVWIFIILSTLFFFVFIIPIPDIVYHKIIYYQSVAYNALPLEDRLDDMHHVKNFYERHDAIEQKKLTQIPLSFWDIKITC